MAERVCGWSNSELRPRSLVCLRRGVRGASLGRGQCAECVGPDEINRRRRRRRVFDGQFLRGQGVYTIVCLFVCVYVCIYCTKHTVFGFMYALGDVNAHDT